MIWAAQAQLDAILGAPPARGVAAVPSAVFLLCSSVSSSACEWVLLSSFELAGGASASSLAGSLGFLFRTRSSASARRSLLSYNLSARRV